MAESIAEHIRVQVGADEEVKTEEHVIGIDLGTTNSCVGYWNAQTQQVEIVADLDGYRTTPSCVGYS